MIDRATRACFCVALLGSCIAAAATVAGGSVPTRWPFLVWPVAVISLVLRTLWVDRQLRLSRAGLVALGGPGIKLRVSSPAGSLIEADSEQLHYIARYGERGEVDGWQELFPGDGMGYSGRRDLVIEIKPATTGVYLPGVPRA